MSVTHKVTIHYRQENKTLTFEIPEGESILAFVESRGEKIPFSCRNGCCTTCAVKIISGNVDQSAGIGLSQDMQNRGYALLCIARVSGPLEVETQEEDEVYNLQFGRYLTEIKSKTGNPFDI